MLYVRKDMIFTAARKGVSYGISFFGNSIKAGV